MLILETWVCLVTLESNLGTVWPFVADVVIKDSV